MRQLYIQQKVFSLSEKFFVKDEHGNDCYSVEGSFFQIPKNFSIRNQNGEIIGIITKKVFSFLPKFFVEVNGKDVLTIEKSLTFFKDHYSISSDNIEIVGDWWDMNFEIYQNHALISRVSKQWFTWGDSYVVDVLNTEFEELILAIVIAIDCVKADEAAASSTSV